MRVPGWFVREHVRNSPEWPKEHAETCCPRHRMLPEDQMIEKVEPEAYVCNCGVSEQRKALLASVKAP